MDKCIHIILTLGKYLTGIFGNHFPREVISLVVLIYRICTKPKISCGHTNTLLIKDRVYVLGRNDNDKFGLGNSNNIHTPQIMMNNIKKIKDADYYTIILTMCGEASIIRDVGD